MLNQNHIRVVDTDVHHNIRDKTDLYPFLTRHFRERLDEYGMPRSTDLFSSNGGYRGARADCFEGEEDVDPRSRFELFDKKLLVDCAVDIAILQGEYTAPLLSLVDVEYSAALCRAFNDWTIAHWLDRDSRYRLALTVPIQDSALAVQEINRLGNHPAVVAVYLICGNTRLYGNRYFDPVYAACADHGLPIALHFSNEGVGMNPAPTASGYPSYYGEMYLLRPQFYQSHLSSFIFEGTFEKFSELKIVFLESGFGWVPSFRWRANTAWKALRAQTPWVKKLPSDYIDQHIRFSTQPFEEPDPPTAMSDLLLWMNGAQTLMFSSDFPHWDFDPPEVIATRVPPEIRANILAKNALSTYPKLA